MSLYAKDFLRGLRRAAWEEIRRAPRLKAEAKAMRRRAKHYHYHFTVLRPFLPLLFFGYALMDEKGGFMSLALAVWGTVLIFHRASAVQGMVLRHMGTTPFIQFPVSVEFIWKHIEGTILRQSLFLAADAAAALAPLAFHAANGRWWGVILGAGAVWVSALATGVILVWYAPRFPFAAVANSVGSFLVLAWVIGSMTSLVTPELLFGLQHAAQWWLPTAAAAAVAGWSVSGQTAFPIGPVLLLVGVTGLAQFAWHRLRAGYAFWETPASAALTAEAMESDAPPAMGVGEVEEKISSGGFLAPRVWPAHGFIERLGHALLSPRERIVADFMLVERPGWSGRYWTGCLLVGAAPWVVWLMGKGSLAFSWLLGVGLIIGLGWMTPLLAGAWPGFGQAPMAHRFVSVFTLWPVGVKEVRNCLLKLNLARCLAALPWWLYAGGALTWFLHDPVVFGMTAAAKCWLVVLILQPVLLVFKYSAGTNDTSSGCLFAFGLLSLSIAVVVGVAATVTLAFMAGPFHWWLLSVAVLSGFSWLFDFYYRAAWRSRRFDLLADSANVNG